MQYKQVAATQNSFTPTREEGNSSIFVDLEDPDTKAYIDFEFDKVLKWMEENVFMSPVTIPIFFDLTKNGQRHSYKATPERIKVILQCLKTRNFDEILRHDNPFVSGDEEIQEFTHVSNFGIRIYPTAQIKSNETRAGMFFNYLLKENAPQCIKDQLRRYQIYTSLVNGKGNRIDDLEDSCFVFALKMTGLFPETVLNQIRLRIQNRFLPYKCIEEICKEFKIHLILHYLTETRSRQITPSYKKFIGVSTDVASFDIEMNLFNKHYFIEEITNLSCYYIKNINTEEENNYNKEFMKDSGRYRKARHFIKSGEFVKFLFENDFFEPITYGHYMVLNTEFHKFQDSNSLNYDLDYDENYCTKLIVDMRDDKKENSKIYFADFESDVSGEIHRPFLCVLQNEDGTETQIFKEGSCGKDLLDYLPNNSITYFHNLAYDIRMFAHYGIRKSIIKGTRCLSANIFWKNKLLSFKDSLALFNCKLSQLPSMFGLTGIEKELFPYKYYTYTQLAESEILTEDEEDVISVGTISEAGKFEDKPWGEEEYRQFNVNIDKIGARLAENKFDMYKYAEFYCSQDVRILRESFNIFRAGFKSDFNIDVFNFVSISSLANEVFKQNVYIPNKNLYKLGGHVRHFCSKAVYGGRCMCAYNKKWHIKKNICDYDAVSLYPSAMARLWTVEGKPKVIEDNQLNMDFLSKQTAYIVEIKINKVNKHYPFPLIVQKKDGLNLNDDDINEPITMIVDNIYLEDLIQFQKIEFDLIKGYYWDGRKDYRIQDEIKKIFEKRVEYKKQKNPLQQLYKLIMNSCYGKTIEKPIDKEIVYIKGEENIKKFIKKNYNSITEIVPIKDSKISAIKQVVPIDQHFNFSLLGIQVLSMSKRIMNEVMCLAYDIGCKIYYQDTDSMHIVKEDLERLEQAFEQKYRRPLKGTSLGQFHTDFTSFTGREDVQHSIESIFLMKKMYIDKLLMGDGSVEYMFRGKGLTTNSILALANENYKGNLMALYEDLFNGAQLSFDLTKGQPCFRMNKDFTVLNIEKFKRKIKTKYQEGNDDEYFK